MKNEKAKPQPELARKKAGRHPIFENTSMKRINIYVDEKTLEKAQLHGNMSEFFRLAAAEYDIL